jgi:hypothetical protein
MSTTNDLTQQAKNEFLDFNRNVLAYTEKGPTDIFKRITAALILDQEAQSDVMMYAPLVDQKGYAGQVAREDFSREIYKAICKCFLRIQRNGVVTFVAKLSGEALAELEAIEVSAGVREAPAPIAPPPPPKSAREQLEDQVIADYNGALSTEKLRKKVNSDAAYRETFNRLSDSDRLQSRITTYTDGGAEFRH